MILQGMKKFKLVYINTITGIVINIILDIPMILILNKIGIPPYLGSLFATMVGLFVSELIVAISLRKEFKFKYKSIINTLLKTLLGTIPMTIIMILMKMLPIYTTRINRILLIGEIGLICIIGVLIYLLVASKTKLLDEVLGKDFSKRILSKFKRGKKNEK
jgi:peptidoglycan biosynthesis protein MviN/MurJ (putative lipid II flippase)